jgi:Flp pilus assembly protein CpaB
VENIMSSKLFRTRQGTILLGVGAAVLAAIVLIVYLNQYRNSVNTNVVPLTVLVAQKPIAKNTTGSVIAGSALIKPVSVAQDKVESGAITNASELNNQVATADISAGQQLTTADFAQAGSSAVGIAGDLSRGQRAVVVPLDLPGQVGDQIAAGDYVDVWALINLTKSNGATTPVAREILPNMYVLNTNTTSTGNVTLRATPAQAGKLIYASGNDKVWLVLRPPHGSVTTPPTITPNTLLGG